MIRDLTDPRAAAIIQRHRSYWYNEVCDRPLYKFDQTHIRPDITTTGPARPYEVPALLDGAKFRDDIERTYDQRGLLHDDHLHMVSTGITSEVLIGCKVVINAGTHWAETCFSDWHQLDDYRVQDSIWYRRLLDNTQRAVDAVGTEKYPFSCMVFRGAVDMAEAMMTGKGLCEAVIDHPRELKELLARITDIIVETATAHATELPYHRDGQFHNFGIWTPGSTLLFTIDAACLFSPACYEEFFLPCDRRLCEAFDAPLIHLHAASRQHFRALEEIPNLGLECVIDSAWLPPGYNKAIGPQLGELMPLFKEIRQNKALMLDGFWDEETLDAAIAELAPGGSAIRGAVEDPAAIRQKYIFQAESPTTATIT